MPRELHNYFTTGEFAALCGTTKHTLLHYDAAGVFSPAVKRENGYRCYAVAQLEVFFVIRILKDLGMPLAEIRSYLDRRSPEALAALLEGQEHRLTERMDHMRRVRALVRQKAALTRQAVERDRGAVSVEEEAESLLLCTPARPFSDSRNSALAVAEHVRYRQAHAVLSAHAIGALLPRAAAEAGDFLDGYTWLYTKVERRPRGSEVRVKPAGRYLTACHEGGYDTVGLGYRRLLDAAAAQGLALGDCFYEDVLLDELSVEGYGDYVLKLSLQVLSD